MKKRSDNKIGLKIVKDKNGWWYTKDEKWLWKPKQIKETYIYDLHKVGCKYINNNKCKCKEKAPGFVKAVYLYSLMGGS